MIEDMPRGTPLETPLHAKRRRNLPKDRVDFNKPKSSGSTFLKSVWTETTTSTLQSPTPLQPEPHIQPSTSTAHILSAPPPIAHIQPSTSTAHILSAPSSPTAHDECEMLTTPTAAQISQPCRRPSRDDQNNDILRYGSEEEYEAKCSDDCGEPQLMPMPRSFRVLLAPDEDTPQEADAAGIVESTPVESGVMHGPISLFDFDWQAFPTPPISPHLRREKFVGSSGPMIGPILSPYEAFILIWDRSIMEHIAHETNIYAQQYAVQLLERGEIGPSSRIADWRDTDVDELYIYFGLMIAMGVLVKSKLEEYWSTDRNIFSTPGFRVNMTLRRFQLLSRCLHFNNNANVPSDIPSRSQAKIYKIKPIVDHLNSKFSSLYGLDQNIALDESLTQWKGLLEINQFIRHKAAEVGIKTYEVCESRTGYLWRFEVHVGGETEDQQVVIPGIIPNLVLRLLRGLEHRGHTVFMDNYYNSPALARVLKSIGYDCVGTLRTNRQFVPDEVKDLKKSEMRVGQVCGCTSGDVDVMVWRDLNRVAMISTYHGNAASENKPILIKDYNVCMGGVDKKDQMLSKYPMERKQTQIWYKKFFKRLLNVSVLNAYILYKHTHHTEHRDFRMSLVTEILQKHEQSRPDIGLRMVHGAPKFSAEVISHLPSRFPVLSGDNRMGRSRRRCVVCKVRTMYHCRACDVALCFSFEDTNSSCYIKHHK